MKLEEVSAHLQAFKPVRARLWDFSPTHDRCVVELTADPAAPQRYLIMLGCSDIRTPTSWTVGAPSLSREGDIYVFRDGFAEIRFHLEAQLVDGYTR